MHGHLYLGPPKTTAGRRPVSLPRVVVEALVEHLAGRSVEPDGFVFALSNGAPLRNASFRTRVWRPATRAAGLEGLRIHDLRHTAIALWIAAGAGPKEVATRAGHTSVSFTLDRYGHLDCAERVLPLFEANAPSDTRPHMAIEGIRAFALGGKADGATALPCLGGSRSRTRGRRSGCQGRRSRRGLRSGDPLHPRIGNPSPGETRPWACDIWRRPASWRWATTQRRWRKIRWAIEHASPAVREVVRRMPVRSPGRSRLDTLLHQLDAGLRG
jgi:hypothetical protein